jgi:hypothetical protein
LEMQSQGDNDKDYQRCSQERWTRFVDGSGRSDTVILTRSGLRYSNCVSCGFLLGSNLLAGFDFRLFVLWLKWRNGDWYIINRWSCRSKTIRPTSGRLVFLCWFFVFFTFESMC